ncbi:toll/interleukin-1 receptor domain-containing protein, partial [Chloroflexota bacterium]
MAHIFISYSRKNVGYAERLHNDLVKRGFEVWRDTGEIAAGEYWEYEIKHGLDACSAVVLLVSPAAKESEWVNKEVKEALKHYKPIFPLLLRVDEGEERWFPGLRHLQHEDVTSGALPPKSFYEQLPRQRNRIYWIIGAVVILMLIVAVLGLLGSGLVNPPVTLTPTDTPAPQFWFDDPPERVVKGCHDLYLYTLNLGEVRPQAAVRLGDEEWGQTVFGHTTEGALWRWQMEVCFGGNVSEKHTVAVTVGGQTITHDVYLEEESYTATPESPTPAPPTPTMIVSTPTQPPTPMPTVTVPTPTQRPTPITAEIPMLPESALLYEEDFEDNHADNWSVQSSFTIVDDGSGNKVWRSTGSGSVFLMPSLDWNNYVMEISYSAVGWGSGLWDLDFCGQRNLNWYTLFIDPDEMGISEGHGGNFNHITGNNIYHRGSAWYTVRLLVDGAKVRWQRDDGTVYETTVDECNSGIGLLTWLSEDILFDDIRIFLLGDEPEVNQPLTSINPNTSWNSLIIENCEIDQNQDTTIFNIEPPDDSQSICVLRENFQPNEQIDTIVIESRIQAADYQGVSHARGKLDFWSSEFDSDTGWFLAECAIYVSDNGVYEYAFNVESVPYEAEFQATIAAQSEDWHL